MKYLVVLLAAALLFAGCTGAGAQQVAGDKAMEDKKAAGDSGDGSMVKKDSGTMAGKNETGAMDKGSDGAMIKKNASNGSMMEKKEGEGAMMKQKASYSPYSAESYQKARTEGRVVYLEFYAPWCPDCRNYEPKLLVAFEKMTSDTRYDGVAGFKVDYDTQNDLKREFGIAGQHTHVIIGKDGEVVVKSREIWSSDDLIANIGKAL